VKSENLLPLEESNIFHNILILLFLDARNAKVVLNIYWQYKINQGFVKNAQRIKQFAMEGQI
jgi:hypothetical protein